jgi:hypothetical protein
VNVKKTKVMVFNFANPCQEFKFEGDVIECVDLQILGDPARDHPKPG